MARREHLLRSAGREGARRPLRRRLGGVVAAGALVASAATIALPVVAGGGPDAARVVDPSAKVTVGSPAGRAPAGLHVSAPTPASGGLVAVGQAPPVPPGATSEGSLPEATPISLDVALAPADPSALSQFVSQVSDPTSPDYGHYLRRGQFAARFGPSATTTAAVRRQLEGDGLAVSGPSADGLLLHASGTAAQVSRALHVGVDRFRLRDGRSGFAATSSPELPAAVARGVTGVTGLSDLVKSVPLLARPHQGGGAAGRPGTAASPGTVGSLTKGSTACSAAKTAANTYTLNTWTKVANAYGFTSAYATGDLGTGVTVGIFELEPYLQSDLAAFKSCFTLPLGEHYGTVSNVAVDGGAGAGGGFGEAILDVEDVLGLAPESNVIMYNAPNTDLGSLDEYDLMVAGDQVQVISTSWGECETVQTPVVAAIENDIFEEAAAQGQTVFSAAGDTGSEDCHFYTSTVTATTTYTPTPTLTTVLAVDDPASQPYVTGVGGTELTITKTHTTTTHEVVWNSRTEGTTPKPRDIAGAGGVSGRWAKPAWQTTGRTPTAVPKPAFGECTTTALGASVSASCRQVPDVSASADPTDGGDDIYCKGAALCTTFTTDPAIAGWGPVGGTSAAAPLWAAMTAVADQSCGTDLGFLNPRLYALGDASGDFRDITTGTNDATGHHAGFYTAKSGYDNASGLGSPDAAKLIAAACPSHVSGPSVQLSSHRAGQTARYTVRFSTSSTLPAGDTITLVGPDGTVFPTSASAYTVETLRASAALAYPTGTSTTANAVTITLSQPVSAGTVTVTVAVGNTTKAGSYTLEVETSLDAAVGAPFTIGATLPDPATSTVVAARPSDRANGTTGDPVTVTVLDQYGNPVATAHVTLPFTTSSGTSAVSPTTTTGVPTSATGTATFTVTDTKSEVVAFRALVTDHTLIDQTATVDFTSLLSSSAGLSTDVAGATDNLSTTFGDATSLTAGSAITVTAPPGSVVPTTVGDYTVTATTHAKTVSSVSVAPGPGSATDNQATIVVGSVIGAGVVKVGIAHMTNPTAAGATFVAIATSVDPVPTDAAVSIVPATPSALATSVTELAPSGPADGASPDLVLVTLRDRFGNLVAGSTVTLDVPHTDPVVLTPGSAISDTTGQALFALADGTAQTVTVTAKATGSTVGSVSISFTGISGLTYVPLTALTTPVASPDMTTGATVDVEAFAQLSGGVGPGGTITLTAPPGTVLPGAPSAYFVENGFDKVQTAFTLGLSKGTGSSTDNVVTLQVHTPSRFKKRGEFVVIEITGVTNPAKAGTAYATLSASGTDDGVPTYSTPLTFTVGPASKARSTVVATPPTLDVGKSSTVTVTVEDASGNRLADQVVRLTPSGAAKVSGDKSTSTPQESTTSSTGTATFIVTDATVQSVSLGATDVTQAVGLGSTSVTFVTPNPPPPPAAAGYDMVGSDGGVFVFPTGQSSGFFGSLPGLTPPVHVDNVVGIVPTDNDAGYDMVGSDGGVFVFPLGQSSGFYGSLPGLSPPVDVNDIVGIVPTNNFSGYDLVGRDGGVFVFPTGQSSGYFGSLPGEGISVSNIVGIAVTGDDKGYWLAGATGHIYNLGDAPTVTSPPISAPIVGIAADTTSKGGWLVARNGAVYPFGDAAWYGTLPTKSASVDNVVSIVPTPTGHGYWLFSAAGAVFAFGDATSKGTLPLLGVNVDDVVGAVPTG